MPCKKDAEWKNTRTFNGKKFTTVGFRETKVKAKKLAEQGRANGYRARVTKIPKALQTRDAKYAVWGSVELNKFVRPKKK